MPKKLERIVKREKLISEVRKWANELLQYNAEDKIDDFNIFEERIDKDYKIIRVMSPVGQELYFKVEPLTDKKFYVELLLDTWEDDPE